MERISRLHSSLVALLRQPNQWADIRHLYTLIWMVIGLIQSGCINLTKWGAYMLKERSFRPE